MHKKSRESNFTLVQSHFVCDDSKSPDLFYDLEELLICHY